MLPNPKLSDRSGRGECLNCKLSSAAQNGSLECIVGSLWGELRLECGMPASLANAVLVQFDYWKHLKAKFWDTFRRFWLSPVQ